MKSKTYLLTYLFTLLGGILLVMLNSRADLWNWIVIVIGALFFVPSVLAVINAFLHSVAKNEYGQKQRKPWLLMIPAIGGVILGIFMIIIPDFFINYLIIAFALVLVACGGLQLYNLLPRMRTLRISPYFLIAPVLTLLLGVVILVIGTEKIKNIAAILTGIMLILYSVNGFIGYYHREHRLRRQNAINPYDKPQDIIEIK